MMLSFLKRKVSLLSLLIVSVISASCTFFITNEILSKTNSGAASNESLQADNCSFRIKRLDGYDLVKPILLVENNCESDNLQLLKQEVSNIISVSKGDGTLISASVYLRTLLSSEWFCLNESESYSPGSILKVPELITYLKMSESQPGILDKKLLFNEAYRGVRKAVNVSESIELGKQYSVRELLKYMIQYSDNNATYLLMKNMDANVFKKVFADFGLTVPNETASDYPMSVSDYSRFLRALFNGSYLNKANSEYAIELLTSSDYKNGILQGIPATLKVAHKFGEEGNPGNQQLHESAIIYLENSPYILTIMTKGKDLGKQSKVLAEISAKIYQSLSSRFNS